MKLYQCLPNDKQEQLPLLTIGDTAINAMCKGYVPNPNFAKKITCWDLLQLADEELIYHKRYSFLLGS